MRVLTRMLDENEFLSPYGIRSLSRASTRSTRTSSSSGATCTAWTTSPRSRGRGLFGGNSNWRGPVWFPVNYLIIEALQKYHHYYGDDASAWSARPARASTMTLWEVASELSRRLVSLFVRGEQTAAVRRTARERLQSDPHFHDHILVLRVLPRRQRARASGRAHQTGWTALVAKLLQQSTLWKACEKR